MESVIGGRDDTEVFERAGRTGFSGVEIELRRQELRDPARERLERLRRIGEHSALEIPSLVLGEHNDGGIADADPVIAEAAHEDVLRAIEWAAALRAGAVLVPFFARAQLAGEADLDRCSSSFRTLCARAAERGVTLLYEGTLPADGIRRLAAGVGSRAFGCYFDLANPVVRGLDSATEVRALGDLVRRVHLKDTRVTAGDCEPGLGRVDFGESARALGEIGYDGWLVLETRAGPPELVARDLSFARTIFPSLPEARPWPRLGAFSYDFGAGEEQRLAETFAKLGLEAVQLGGDLLAECLEHTERIEPIRTTLAEHGIAVVGLAGYRNLVAPHPTERAAGLVALRRCLELAPAFGTSIVTTETGTRHPGGDWTDAPENWSAEAWALLDDALETLLPTAERCGSLLALEGHVKNVLKTQGQLLGLLERFPSRRLAVVCDPYNYLSRHLVPAQERSTRDLLERFEHRFVLAHGKDVDAGGAEAGTPELGTGVFAQRPYLEFLRTRRPDLPLILEHLPLEHLPAGIRRIRGLSEAVSTAPRPA
ncbi:MAG: sugar phosphate isomerase/epimerase [Actinobacteria bacterium]|nr:sugar phosphate isomerase/epimerase [Actinomycetota bacterium]